MINLACPRGRRGIICVPQGSPKSGYLRKIARETEVIMKAMAR
jgi:hypothetical protein